MRNGQKTYHTKVFTYKIRKQQTHINAWKKLKQLFLSNFL